MKKIIRYIVPCSLLIVFWMIPMLETVTADGIFIRSAVANALFLAAAVCSRALPNRHVALVSALLTGVIFCIVQPAAVFDVLPVLLLCCWLRCYLEKEKDNNVSGWFEVITDLIYLSLVATIVRLVRSGYSFMDISKADRQTVPDIALMILILLLFAGLFAFNAGGEALKVSSGKDKRKQGDRASRGIAGLIPVFTTLRTFWGFCAILLAASILMYTDRSLIVESNVLARSGMRFLSFPWMILLFCIIDGLLPETVAFRKSRSS